MDVVVAGWLTVWKQFSLNNLKAQTMPPQNALPCLGCGLLQAEDNQGPADSRSVFNLPLTA